MKDLFIFFIQSKYLVVNGLPSNPKWMDGARSGAIIPLVLFKKANVKWIIPSDLNLINGVINDLN